MINFDITQKPKKPKKRTSNKLKKLWRLFTWIVSTTLAVLTVIVIISIIPIKGNISMLTVTSGSMSPKIPVGSLAIIKPIQRYEVGDIITFQKKEYSPLVTHRIVEANDRRTSFTTKGDANKTEDYEKITRKNIKGKVMLWVPFVGKIVDYAKSLNGLILLIFIPAGIIAFDELKSIKNALFEMKTKRHERFA